MQAHQQEGCQTTPTRVGGDDIVSKKAPTGFGTWYLWDPLGPWGSTPFHFFFKEVVGPALSFVGFLAGDL